MIDTRSLVVAPMDGISDVWDAEERRAKRIRRYVFAGLASVSLIAYVGRSTALSVGDLMLCITVIFGAFVVANAIACCYWVRYATSYREARSRGYEVEILRKEDFMDGWLDVRTEQYRIDGDTHRAQRGYPTPSRAFREGLLDALVNAPLAIGTFTAMFIAPLFLLFTHNVFGALLLFAFGALPFVFWGGLLIGVEVLNYVLNQFHR